jgi:hypothetical protein
VLYKESSSMMANRNHRVRRVSRYYKRVENAVRRSYQP